MPPPSSSFAVLTEEELARMTRLGRRAGVLLGGILFAGPGLLGLVLDGSDPLGLPTALALLAALTLLVTMICGVGVPAAAKREGPSVEREVDAWVTLADGERLEAVCPARVLGTKPSAGALVVTSARVLFLEISGSRRRVAPVGPRDAITFRETPPETMPGVHSWLAHGGRRLHLVAESRSFEFDVGVRHERLLSWVPEWASPVEGDLSEPAEPAWETLERVERARSDVRLVARPLRCSLARGALTGIASLPFVEGPLTPILFGAWAAAVAGVEYEAATRSRVVRYLVVVSVWALSLCAVFALAGHEAARTAGALGTQEAYEVALSEVFKLLSATGISEGLVTVFLCGVGLALALQTTWRLRVLMAGLVVIAAAAATTPLVVTFEVWFLVPMALGTGFQLGIALIMLSVFVDVSDAWLLARRELEQPPSWFELCADQLLRRKKDSVGLVDDPSPPVLEGELNDAPEP